MKSDLLKYGIVYDEWFLESTLHNDGELAETIQILKDQGATYEKDGAVWYRATAFGAEKDEVLVRSNGNPTYFAADIAYHRNKFAKRGFDRCIDVWGTDHHGHVARMKEAMKEANLSEPEFHTEGMFTVMFKRQAKNNVADDIVKGIVKDTINEKEKAIINLLAKTPGLNASQISKHMSKSLRTTMRYIKILQDKDLIEFRGAPKNGGYFLAD